MDRYDWDSELRGDMSQIAVSGTVVRVGRWIAGIIAAVIGGAMLLLLSCTYNEVTATGKDMASVKTQLQLQGQQNDREFRRIDGELTRHDQRLTDLERSESPRQPDAYHR